MNEEYEKEIDLKDLFAGLLHCWRTILICMILFMILVGGVMSYRDYLALQSAADTSGAGYKAMTEEMTADQISNAEQFYKRYDNYQDRVEETQKYIDESAMMKLNANAVSKYAVEYYVESGYSNIIASFAGSAIDMDDYEQIAQILGGGIDPHYVSELISLGGDVAQDSYDIDTDKVGDVINGNISQTYKGVLRVEITTNDRASGEQVAQVIDAAILEHVSKLQAAGIDVEVSPLTTNYKEVIDKGLAEYQRAKTEEISNMIKDFNEFYKKAKETLDEKEYALLQYYVDMREPEIGHVHWKKWIVLGAAAGMCVGIILIAFRYLVSPQIKTMYELKTIYKNQELGIVFAPAKSRVFIGKLFHQWAEAIEHSGLNKIKDTDAVEIIASRIAGILQNGEDAAAKKTVYLVSDINDGYTATILEQCVELLGKQGVKAVSGNPLSSVKELDALRKAGSAVMVSTIKQSLPVSVQDGLTICEENHIPVIGNFVVYPQA